MHAKMKMNAACCGGQIKTWEPYMIHEQTQAKFGTRIVRMNDAAIPVSPSQPSLSRRHRRFADGLTLAWKAVLQWHQVEQQNNVT